MADKKITQLTNITGADLVDADEFVVVDISADETKAITLGELKEAFDSGSGFVRITGDTMTGPLDVQSTITSEGLTVDQTSGYVLLQDLNAAVVSGTDMGGVKWRTGDSTVSGSNRITAAIRAEGDGTFNAVDKAPTKLVFSTHGNSGVDPVDRMTINSDGDISFYEDTGTTAKFFWDASAESLGIGTTSLSTNSIIKELHIDSPYTNGVSRLRLSSSVENMEAAVGLTGYLGDDALYFAIGSSGDGSATERMRIDSSGNVGIGTSSPSETLHIRNTLGGENGAILIESFAPNIKFNDLSSPVPDYQILVNGGFNIKRDAAGDGTFEVTDFSIDSSGNVGIGTSSPTDKLNISSGSNQIGLDTGNQATYGTLDLGHFTNGAFIGTQAGTNAASNLLRFGTSGTERMRITSSGSVGIGKSSPGAKLDVAGVAIIDGGTGVSSSGVFHVRQNGNGSSNGITITSSHPTSHRIWKDSAGNLNIGSSNSPSAFVQNTSGNVGIGTNSPNADLELGGVGEVMRLSGSSTNAYIRNTDGTTNQWYIGSGGNAGLQHYIYQAQPMTFHTSGLERLRIDSSGRVGINTSDPVENLTVGATTTAAGFSLGSATTQAYLRYNNYFSGTSQVSDATKGSASISLGRSSDGVITFNTAAAGAGTPSEAMRITSSGNVGIGESSPDGKIDIAVNGANEKIHSVRPAGGSGSPQFGFKFRWGDDGDSPEIGLTHGGSYSNAGLYFDTMSGGSKVSAMRIDSSGNVGIGTDSPGVKFVVANGADAAVSTQIFGADETTEYLGFGQNGAQSVITAGSAGAQSVALVFRTAASGAETERMRIDSSGRAGIGTSSPISILETYNTSSAAMVSTTTTGYSGFRARSTSGNFYYFIDDSTGSAFGAGAYSRVLWSDGAYPMVFGTNATERMRIDSSGNLLVGKTGTSSNTAGTTLWADGFLNSTVAIASANTSYVARFNRKTSDGSILDLQKDGTTVGSIGVSGSDITTSASGSAGGLTWDWQSSGATRKFIAYQNALRPNTANNGAIDLGSDTGKWRDLYLSGGVYLGGTGAANKLDDYEEGTWTVTTNSGTITANTGFYRKVGDLVYATAVVGNFSDITSSTEIQLSLPFTSSNTSGLNNHGSVMSRYIGISGDSLTAYIGANSPFVNIYHNGTNTNNWSNLTYSDLTSTSAYLRFSISYIV